MSTLVARALGMTRVSGISAEERQIEIKKERHESYWESERAAREIKQTDRAAAPMGVTVIGVLMMTPGVLRGTRTTEWR
jgi:hypothetical protein